MSTKRSMHAAVICGSKVFALGGNDENNFLDSCEAYNIYKDKWQFLKSMNVKKNSFAATAINNEFIYTFGGFDGRNIFDDIERYDIS